MFTTNDISFLGKRMSRDFALSSVSGLSSASVVSLLSHLLASSAPPLLEACPLCPDLPDLDWGSFFFGLGCGVLLLPLCFGRWLCGCKGLDSFTSSHPLGFGLGLSSVLRALDLPRV